MTLDDCIAMAREMAPAARALGVTAERMKGCIRGRTPKDAGSELAVLIANVEFRLLTQTVQSGERVLRGLRGLEVMTIKRRGEAPLAYVYPTNEVGWELLLCLA